MVRQYPYILQVMTTTPGSFNTDGDPVEPVSDYVTHAKCRDEANSGAKQINVDGTSHIFQALIQLPKGTAEVKVGTRVRVVQGTDIRLLGTVKSFRSDQLHCRIWV